MTEEANKRQIGGEHYGLRPFQHWDMVEEYGMGYLEGCATKYLSRWRKKGGIQDLEKADHYVQKLIEIGRGPRGYVSHSAIARFCEESGIEWASREAACLSILCRGWYSVLELEAVRKWIAELKREALPQDVGYSAAPKGVPKGGASGTNGKLGGLYPIYGFISRSPIAYGAGGGIGGSEIDDPPAVLATCSSCEKEITNREYWYTWGGKDLCKSCYFLGEAEEEEVETTPGADAHGP